MKLKTIVCSGANEHTSIEGLINVISRYPQAEIGVQVSGKKAAYGSERYKWLKNLIMLQQHYYLKIPLALHLNQDWVERFCAGDVPDEVQELLQMYDHDNQPFIRRVQLNFKIGREKTPELHKLLSTVIQFPKQRFILSCNKSNEQFITGAYGYGVKFDCLYDDSHGEGVLAGQYQSPLFDGWLHGYAGGLTPENVQSELDKIAQVVPKDQEIFIDAEGGLKGEDKHLSLAKTEEYLLRASQWNS